MFLATYILLITRAKSAQEADLGGNTVTARSSLPTSRASRGKAKPGTETTEWERPGTSGVKNVAGEGTEGRVDDLRALLLFERSWIAFLCDRSFRCTELSMLPT